MNKDLISSTGTSAINLTDLILSKFVFHQFFSRRFPQYCKDRMTGTSYPASTPLKDIEKHKIFITNNKNLIIEESKNLDEFNIGGANLRYKISSSQALLKNMINQVF